MKTGNKIFGKNEEKRAKEYQCGGKQTEKRDLDEIMENH